MSVRRGAASAALVAAAVIGGVLLVPAAASAAPASASASSDGLGVTVGDAVRDTVTRGHGEDGFTLTVSNPTGKALPFTGTVVLTPLGGPSPLAPGQLTVGVQPLTAPATDTSVLGENPGLFAQFFPQGGNALKDPFRLPAGSSYSWKVTFGFAAGFPGNDDGVRAAVDISVPDGGHVTPDPAAPMDFGLSPALPDGEVTEHFSGDVSLSPGHPGQTTLTVDNGAGGSFTSPLETIVEVHPAKGDALPDLKGLTLEYRTGGGAWTQAEAIEPGEGWALPDIPAGFAYQQTRAFDLRFSLPAGSGNRTTAEDLTIDSLLRLGGTVASAEGTLHYAPAAGGTSPSSSGTTGTAGGADSGASLRLAETGSPHADLFAGAAALFAAAGAALALAARRRPSA
ncbi:hypothetical protein [Streptomyces sp. NPDC021020]|uniref:hypothetical protein n=1 Tax=Streptomyces sp. NPDC021020 TaxID=3365109 RepID=UPI0037AA0225